MVGSAYRIKDVVKNSDIILNKDKNDNGNVKDKGKTWNKNNYLVNNGVVGIPKTKEETFNLTSAIYAAKK